MHCLIGCGKLQAGCWRWLLLLLLWVVSAAGTAAPAPAPPDTLHLNYTDSGRFRHYFAYCFDPDTKAGTGARADSLWQAGAFQTLMGSDTVQGSYRQNRLWLRVVVVNTLPQRTHFVWNLYQFVDEATLFVQPDGRGPLQAAGRASAWVVAARRPFPARAVCLPFWLETHARAVLYLRVENNTGGWYLPTDLGTTEGFLRFENTYLIYTHWIWLLGLYLGSGLLNLLLFAFLRDRIHLWYGAYVLFSTWFLLMEDSLDSLLLPQATYRLGWQLGKFGMLLLALACGLRIMALFVRLRQTWPRLHRLSWALTGLAAAYALAYPLLSGTARQSGSAALAWLNGGRDALLWVLLLAGALGLTAVGWWGRPPQRRLARLYALTYVFFFFGTAGLLLNYSGLGAVGDLVEPNSLAWGLALELASLSVLLLGRYRHTQRQNTEQRLRRLRERELAGQRLIAAQDEEREKLARELHDALAPGLTALHLAWQGRQVRQALALAPALLTEAHSHTEALLRTLRHEVRSLSQALLPIPAGEALPLPEALALLTETISLTDDGPHIGCDCDPSAAELPAALQAAAYRLVAELLHNALRHARACQIMVEVRRGPTSLHLRVQDDGQGFDPDAPAPTRGGLGLRGVRARVGYLRGQVVVKSRLGEGTLVLVDLPVS